MREKNEYGTLVREARKRAGLTRQEVYKIWGIPQTTLVGWELGSRIPPTYTAKMLINELDRYCEKLSFR